MSIPIKYIGPKRVYVEHLYQTGLTWEPGQVVDVPEEAAVKLLRHPEFEDMRKNKTPIVVTKEVEEPEEPDEDLLERVPLANLEGLTKEQLVSYAHRNFGVVLDSSLKKADLIEAVRLNAGKRP